MKVRIRRTDGLYLHREGGFTNKANAALIKLKRANKLVARLHKKGIVAEVEYEKRRKRYI